MREIVNGIFYVMLAGCAWRLMPSDLPAMGDDLPLVRRLASVYLLSSIVTPWPASVRLSKLVRRRQPKDAHPDRTPHGARRPNYEL